MTRLAVVLGVAAFVEALVSLWWWALFGMSDNVGWAHALTVLALGSAAGFVATFRIGER